MMLHIHKLALTLLLAVTIATGLGFSTSNMAFASTKATTTSAGTPALTNIHSASGFCPAYIVPQYPYGIAIVNKAQPSVVVFLQAVPAGYNLIYYLWISTNGVNGNPMEEGSREEYTFIGSSDIYLMGYVGNTPAVSVCSDWIAAGYKQMD